MYGHLFDAFAVGVAAARAKQHQELLWDSAADEVPAIGRELEAENAAARSGQRIGYVRVSTADQSVDRQLEGIPRHRTFTDHASGGSRERPELQALLLHVREGDTVLVHSIDRLARNLDDLRALVRGLVDRRVRIEFVKEALVFTGDDAPMSTMLLSMIGAFAEFERALIRERQREGISIAKGKGKYRGKVPFLSSERAGELRRRCAEPGAVKAAIAREFGIGLTTLYDYLKQEESDAQIQKATGSD
jgi:DNA invertase Pin-like site-specific DNA recombinase